MDSSTPGFPVHHQVPEPTQTHVHRVGDAIQPSYPLCPLLPPSVFRVFSSESILHIRWPKYWSFSFSISPSNEYSGLISCRFGNTIALTRQTFVGKVLSLLLNMLSRLVIAFLPRSKLLLISWLQSPSAVIWDPEEIKSLTVSIVYPCICHGVMGPDVMILVF